MSEQFPSWTYTKHIILNPFFKQTKHEKFQGPSIYNDKSLRVFVMFIFITKGVKQIENKNSDTCDVF